MALRFGPGSLEYLRTVAPKPRKTIREALRLLEEDARHAKLELRLLRVKADVRIFRAKVGDYGIVYAPRPDCTYIHRIQHRREGYEWLDRLFP